MKYQEILVFWFEELRPEQWYRVDESVDQQIKSRFLNIHQQAKRGDLTDWQGSPEGSLAEIIVLDQFSRNIYRNQAEAFASDTRALSLAEAVVERGFDEKLTTLQRSFIYLPYMHSELAEVHERAVILFQALGRQDNLDYEYKHKAIIDRFGRYPHRNKVLGRTSTPEEIEFLKTPGSSF